MSGPPRFTRHPFEADIIRCAVRWYRRDALSSRGVEAVMREGRRPVAHPTIVRGVPPYAPDRDQRCQPRPNATNDSYRVDETHSTINKQWSYRDRAVDATDAARDLMLSATRDADAVGRFFRSRVSNRMCGVAVSTARAQRLLPRAAVFATRPGALGRREDHADQYQLLCIIRRAHLHSTAAPCGHPHGRLCHFWGYV